MKIMVMGAGGMGALFGSILANGGMEVVLVDSDQGHVDAINRQGLKITGFGPERLQKMTAVGDAGQISSADIVLVQCKGTATRQAAQSMRHLAGTGTVFISFQNGLGNEEELADCLGTENVLGGLTAMAAAKLGPGHIQDFSRVPSYIGEMQGGVSERVARIAAHLTAAGLETHPSDHIRTDIWKKLLGNMAMSAASGLTNLSSAELLAIPAMRQVCMTALDEAISIARAEGIELDYDEVLHGLEMITEPGGTGDNKSSLCLDLLAGRHSEVEFIYGTPLQLADKAGLAVPVLRSYYGLVKGVETHFGKGR